MHREDNRVLCFPLLCPYVYVSSTGTGPARPGETAFTGPTLSSKNKKICQIKS